jgi:predicted dehydrogenase
MSEQTIRFGLVGAGGIAQAYVQAFEQFERAELVAIADLRPNAALALAELARCASFLSYEAMVEATELDAVIICTPPSTHPTICLDLLAQGKHILCEKPFSIDAQSAFAMKEAAVNAGVLLTMASKFRYAEDVIRAKSIIDSGILGEVVLFENAFTTRIDMSNRWNSIPAISGGGVLMDNGTHSVDIMRYFLGPLAEIQVVEGKRVQGLAVEDTVRIFAKSERGVMGNIDLSWSINKDLDYYLRIYGSNGTISVGWKESKYRQSSSQDWVTFGQGYNKIQSFRAQIENFSKAILQEEPLRISIEDAIASVEVMEVAYRSLNQNHWSAIRHSINDSPALAVR